MTPEEERLIANINEYENVKSNIDDLITAEELRGLFAAPLDLYIIEDAVELSYIDYLNAGGIPISFADIIESIRDEIADIRERIKIRLIT